MPLTETQLADIRARSGAATSAPWSADTATDGRTGGVRAWVTASSVSLGRITVAFVDGQTTPNPENAAFIAAARTDVPLLLDEVAALSRQVADLEGILRDMQIDSHAFERGVRQGAEGERAAVLETLEALLAAGPHPGGAGGWGLKRVREAIEARGKATPLPPDVLHARVRRLCEALRPFAEWIRRLDTQAAEDRHPDRCPLTIDPSLNVPLGALPTAGDCRHAAALLAELEDAL